MNIICFTFIILGIGMFFIGIHNIDQAWNMQYLQDAQNLNLVDNSMFISYGKTELYRLGTLLLFAGFIVSLVSVSLFFNKK